MADGKIDKLGLCDKLILNDWVDIIILSDSLVNSLYLAKYKLYFISMFTLSFATDKERLWRPRPMISCAYVHCSSLSILARPDGAYQGVATSRNISIFYRVTVNDKLRLCSLFVPTFILARRAAACQGVVTKLYLRFVKSISLYSTIAKYNYIEPIVVLYFILS